MIKQYLATVIVLFATSTSAAPITWYLNTTVEDGGTVTGSFQYDASLAGGGSYSGAADIVAEGTQLGSTFSLPIFYSPHPGSIIFSDTPIDINNMYGAKLFSGSLASSLTDAGGTITINHGQIFDCPRVGIDSCLFEPASSFSVTGSVSTVPSEVPLPAALWFFASGLLGLFLARHTQ